jgi:hypothetical protein
MSVTHEQVEKLKADWKADPNWNLAETEGFEDHVEELAQFQKDCEAEWEAKIQKRAAEIDAKADELGVQGLYLLFLKQEEMINRIIRAIGASESEGNIEAYRIIQGYDI